MPADIHLGKHVRVFAEGKTPLATEHNLPGGRRSLDIDSGDLLNTFVDRSMPVADGGKMTFRAGRQELIFGKQRLVSPLPWSNSFRAFEGFPVNSRSVTWKIAFPGRGPSKSKSMPFINLTQVQSSMGFTPTERFPDHLEPAGVSIGSASIVNAARAGEAFDLNYPDPYAIAGGIYADLAVFGLAPPRGKP